MEDGLSLDKVATDHHFGHKNMLEHVGTSPGPWVSWHANHQMPHLVHHPPAHPVAVGAFSNSPTGTAGGGLLLLNLAALPHRRRAAMRTPKMAARWSKFSIAFHARLHAVQRISMACDIANHWLQQFGEMSVESPPFFAEELLQAPAGVALLAQLEVSQREDIRWIGWAEEESL